MDTIEKVYCTGHDNNDDLVSALASKNNCDPIEHYQDGLRESTWAEGYR